MKKKQKILGCLCIYILAIAPPILLLIYIRLFGVNVVYADEWVIVPLVQKFYSGELAWADFFVKHNEHIMLFPRVALLSLALLTHHNTIAVMYFSWALTVVTLGLIFLMFKEDLGNSPSALLKFLPVVWLLFTFRQYESILFSFAVNMYLCPFGFVASIYFLGKSRNAAFVGAVCSAIVSSFSAVNGLLVWPIGIICIASAKMKNKPLFILSWIGMGIIIWTLYLHDWPLTDSQSTLSNIFAKTFVALTFFIMNIATPLAFVKSSASGMGTVAAIYLFIILVLMVRRGPVNNPRWLALILFSLGSSFLFTLGRVNYGLWAALASRYVPFTVLGIIGAYAGSLSFYEKPGDTENKRYAVLYGAILSTIIVGVISGYTSGIVRGKEIHDERTHMVRYLIDYEKTDDSKLQTIYPDAHKLRERAKILEELRLNVFQKKGAEP
jgi:hypothetical protein